MIVGIIAKDHEGKVLVSMCSTKLYISDLLVAEALAAWKVVTFSKYLRFQNIMNEGNARKIVHALRALRKAGCY